jgi:bidirectional [NiFe] hydrogenase diaphorase subunit
VLDAGMKRHRYAPDALIEVLHQAQELFGHLRPDILTYVAHGLKLPPSRVYGVATFYHFFTFTPRGDHTCVVCLGTACYVKGGEAVMHAARQALRENPSLGAVSIEPARCLGACSLAPVVVLDGEVVGNTSPEACRDRMKGWVPDGS